MVTDNGPINASAIILGRPGVNGEVEVFMTRYPSAQSSVENYSFPVCPVQKEDTHEAMLDLCYGLTPREARDALGSDLTPELSLGHWVAGIRGLFEQTGILLCTSEGKGSRTGLSKGFKDEFTKNQRLFIKGNLSFRTLLKSEGLYCDARHLSYFSHWLAEDYSPRSYDTRFFLASLPADQEPIIKSWHQSTGIWINPEGGMDLFQRESLFMTFATFASIRSLADYDSWDTLVSEHGLFEKSRPGN